MRLREFRSSGRRITSSISLRAFCQNVGWSCRSARAADGTSARRVDSSSSRAKSCRRASGWRAHFAEPRLADHRQEMNMKPLTALGAVLLACNVLYAQAPAQKVEFEVATIKKSPPPGTDNAVTAGIKMDGSQVRIGMLTLRDYIAMAHRVKPYQIVGPDWIATERFYM